MMPALHIATVPEASYKFYAQENLDKLDPYVRQLIADGFPLWMVDFERSILSDGEDIDTEFGLGILKTWNCVRQYHGFPKLTIEELNKRGQD